MAIFQKNIISMSKLSLTSETDEVLYKNFMIGDEMAFTAIYERYERGILTYLKTTMRDQPAAADDLFQETFIRLYRERTRQAKALETGGDYRPIENLKFWLFRVAHNLAMSYLRIGKRTVSLTVDEDDDNPNRWDERLMVPVEESFAELYGNEDIFSSEQLYSKLLQCVELLPKSLKEVYVLREMNGFEYEEISETIGVSEEAARMRLSRARKTLRKALKKYIKVD